MYDATVPTGGQFSLQELDARIRACEESRARELAECVRATEAAAARLDGLVHVMAECGRRAQEQSEILATAVRDLLDAGTNGVAREIPALAELKARLASTQVEIGATQLGLARVEEHNATARLRAAASEFASARARLAAVQQSPDPQLDAWRTQRDHLLRHMATRVAPPRPAPDAGAAPELPRLPSDQPPTKEELKALRAAIRHQERGDWKDLPAFYGTGDLPQRDCRHCGTPVPENRKRFCSRDCHRIFLQIHGSTARSRGERLA